MEHPDSIQCGEFEVEVKRIREPSVSDLNDMLQFGGNHNLDIQEVSVVHWMMYTLAAGCPTQLLHMAGAFDGKYNKSAFLRVISKVSDWSISMEDASLRYVAELKSGEVLSLRSSERGPYPMSRFQNCAIWNGNRYVALSGASHTLDYAEEIVGEVSTNVYFTWRGQITTLVLFENGCYSFQGFVDMLLQWSGGQLWGKRACLLDAGFKEIPVSKLSRRVAADTTGGGAHEVLLEERGAVYELRNEFVVKASFREIDHEMVCETRDGVRLNLAVSNSLIDALNEEHDMVEANGVELNSVVVEPNVAVHEEVIRDHPLGTSVRVQVFDSAVSRVCHGDLSKDDFVHSQRLAAIKCGLSMQMMRVFKQVPWRESLENFFFPLSWHFYVTRTFPEVTFHSDFKLLCGPEIGSEVVLADPYPSLICWEDILCQKKIESLYRLTYNLRCANKLFRFDELVQALLRMGYDVSGDRIRLRKLRSQNPEGVVADVAWRPCSWVNENKWDLSETLELFYIRLLSFVSRVKSRDIVCGILSLEKASHPSRPRVVWRNRKPPNFDFCDAKNWL